MGALARYGLAGRFVAAGKRGGAGRPSERPLYLSETAATLLTAWVAIRLAAGAPPNPGLRRTVAVTALAVAALNILGLWQDTVAVPRVLRNPAPAPRILGFGENGADLELRIWIEDPQGGVINVASDVMLEIWRRFHTEDADPEGALIEFPFPQRIVHFAKGKSPTPPDLSDLDVV